MKEEIIPIQDEIVLYQSEDGNVKVDVLFQDETVWLTQSQLCMLFGKSKATISEHIKHIFEEGELDDKVVVRNSEQPLSTVLYRDWSNPMKQTSTISMSSSR